MEKQMNESPEAEEKSRLHRPMNGWEALDRIVANLSVCAVFLGVVGVIYLLAR